jgi:hypothetical protein
MRHNFYFLSFIFLPGFSFSQVSVLTHHNDNMRTGLNTNESILNVSNVDTLHFGKLCERLVDDEVYAQPLVVGNVDMNGFGIRNVLYIATVNNSVYAYDADNRMIANPYWSVNLTPPNSRVIRAMDYSQAGACNGDFRDFAGNIGIVSTPCIDKATNTIYVVTKNKVTLSGEYEQWLHALDIVSGAERPNSPVKIEASMPGNGFMNTNGVMYFNAFLQNQRAALLLSNGVVYITWAGYCDFPPYNGWVLGYDAQSLQRVVTWSVCPDGWDGGVWMSGGGISEDTEGNIYLCTGNGAAGDSGDATDLSNRGQSIIKLTRNDTTLNVKSYFTPYNWISLNDIDADMGTCAVMLIPGTDMALTVGKEGILYVADKDSMGEVDSVDHVRQKINVNTLCSGGTAYWHSDAGDYIYLWPSFEQPMLRYTMDHSNNTLDTASRMESTMTEDFIPGGILSVSSNGSEAGTGIVWANVPLDWSQPGVPNRPSILRAFDASDITHELWNSEMNKNRDSISNYPKFVPPTIANGRVYMATFSGKVLMYGIFNPDGIEETIKGELKIYPNPVTDKVTIDFGAVLNTAEINVLNSLSQTVYSVVIKSARITELDLSDLSKGMYVLHVETPSQVLTSRILKAE